MGIEKRHPRSSILYPRPYSNLQHLKSRFENCPQKIIDVRLARVEVEDGDAAFEAEVDLYDSGNCVKRCAKNREIFALEAADGKYRGFSRGLSHGQVNLTEVVERFNWTFGSRACIDSYHSDVQQNGFNKVHRPMPVLSKVEGTPDNQNPKSKARNPKQTR